MFADSPNVAILAAAGSRKTEQIIDAALSTTGRVLVTTFTVENRSEIIRRIEQRVGTVPQNVDVIPWFSFLIAHGAKPYQSALLGKPFFLKGLNFEGEPRRGTPKADAARYFVDRAGNLYRKHLASFVFEVNQASGGAVVERLARIYDAILVDEIQDLVGWDLDVLDLFMAADLNVLMVGDPRQHTYSTNTSNKNKKYRGVGMVDWLDERSDVCLREQRSESYRCHQKICDFADGIYPDMPATTAVGVANSGHDGIFTISGDEVAEYVKTYDPVILRRTRKHDTRGLTAMNIGVAKGRTFDRVLIFPTNPMKQYLQDNDASRLRSPESALVAVTRARFSASFVVD